MADEQLRLVASVQDGFTAPLQRLKSQLQGIATNPVGKLVQKDWQAVGDELRKVTGQFQQGFAPVLSSVGIASLGVGTALAGVITTMRGFAVATRDMGIFGRQVGLSVDQLNAIKGLGSKFGVDWSEAQGSLKTLAGTMDQLRHNWGKAYGELQNKNLGDLAAKLAAAPNMQAAFETALAGIRAIKNPVHAREVAQLLLGSDMWATVAKESMPNALAEIRSKLVSVSPEMEKGAKDFVDSWNRMEGAVERFKVKIFGPMLPEMAEALDKLSKPVGDALNSRFDGIHGKMRQAIADIGTLKSLWDALSTGNGSEALQQLRKLDGASGPLARRLAPQAGDDVLDAQDKVQAIEERLKRAEGLQGGAADRMGLVDRSAPDRIRAELKAAQDELARVQEGDARRRLGEAMKLREQSVAKQAEADRLDKDIAAREGRGEDATEDRRKRDRLTDEVRKLTDEIAALRRVAGIQPSSFGGAAVGGGLGGLIQTAAFGAGVGSVGGGVGFGSGRGGYGPPADVAGDAPRRGGGVSGPAPAGGDFAPAGKGTGAGHIASQAERETYIRAEATKRGIDPNIAMRIARSEGFKSYVGDKGTSFGDWQLHFKNNIPGLSNAGLGDTFKSRHGLDARDPRTWREQTQFALDEAAKSGWGPWHGRSTAGVGIRDGLGGARPIGVEKLPPYEAERPSPSARGDSSANQNFPPIKTLADWEKASGASAVPYPKGWSGGPAATGDSLMQRAFGPGGPLAPAAAPVAPRMEASGSVHVTLGQGLEKHTVKAVSDGMFKDVRVTRGAQMSAA